MVADKSNTTNNNTKVKIKLGRIVLIVGVVVILVTLVQWTEFYSSDPIRGKVIDARTKEPVEGAIVMVDWLVVGMEGRHVQQLAVQEAVTDKDGHFEIPGWGPKLMKYGLYTVLRNNEPTLRIFKSEYVPIVRDNQVIGKQHRHLLNSINFTFNDNTFELEPFQGSIKEYAKKSKHLESSMLGFYGDTTKFCDWKLIPRFLIALHKQATIFRENKILTSLRTLDSIGSKQCGNAGKVFKENTHENNK